MASVYIGTRQITDRKTSKVEKRYDVRLKFGRAWKTEHCGTFGTRGEAEERQLAVRNWVAGGKSPREELAKMKAPAPETVTFNAIADEWLAIRRRKLADSTAANYAQRLDVIKDKFGRLDPSTITYRDVNAWIDELGETFQPGTIGLYMTVFRQVLDHGDIEPNPARSKKVVLESPPDVEIDPPDGKDVLLMLQKMAPRHLLLVITLELIGTRVSEACQLISEDIDRDKGCLTFRREYTKTKRPRSISVPRWLLDNLPTGGRLFPGANRRKAYEAMRAACELAGVSNISPHDLRHRRATLWHQSGVNAVDLAARLGHSRPSISLDVYAHVRKLTEIDAQELARLARKASTSRA